ncbi:STAS domain-containing protein [Streptomyces endocoffeicus]|uniref:STAS domain-containing protein n=1 Tax=Streptomyces endocoffeicus TaxID=2898945 RepID=UPI0027DCA574|nr:STAS domain-containing protein [Streptomyces endocoffeicus]
MHARDISVPEPGHRSPYRPVIGAALGISAGSAPTRPSATLLTDSYPEGPRKVVLVNGEVDYETAPAMSAELRNALRDSAEGVDVDLSAVRFWDCSALNALLRLRREAHAHGKTVIVRSPSRTVSRVLGLTGTARLFRPSAIPSPRP